MDEVMVLPSKKVDWEQERYVDQQMQKQATRDALMEARSIVEQEHPTLYQLHRATACALVVIATKMMEE